jgi:CheY-like chemotaxis protein
MAILEDDQQFDCIICDLLMPETTGMDLHEWLVARNSGLAEKMIFVTGGAFTRRAREFIDRVENPMIEKPFDPRRLLACLGTMLARAESPAVQQQGSL